MHAELSAIEQEFESALARLRDLCARVPPEIWKRRPAPERWSPGECVAHLNLSSASMVPLVRAGIDEARRSGRPAPARYRRDLLGWLLWRGLGPGKGFKTKAIPAWVPSGDHPPGELVAEFERWQTEQIALVRAADGLPIDAVKIASPVDARARYNIFAALSIMARHQHRHLWQAEQAARS
jgi:DinB family protein